MTDAMQKRRDAFTFLTDEVAPNEPKRWLVTWGSGDAFQWRGFDSGAEAITFAEGELSGWEWSLQDLDWQ